MKRLVLSLITVFAATQAFATVQTLTGTCTVRTPAGVQSYDFSAAPDTKWKLGIAEDTSRAYKEFQISVVNNIGNGESASNWGHMVLISVSPLQRTVVNPPVLCVTTPEDQRLACERDNELSGSYGTRFTNFGERYNDGWADDEAKFFPLRSFANGARLNTGVYRLSANTSINCKATWIK